LGCNARGNTKKSETKQEKAAHAGPHAEMQYIRHTDSFRAPRSLIENTIMRSDRALETADSVVCYYFLPNRSDAESGDPNAFIAEIYRGMSARHAVGKAVPNAGDGKTSRCCGRVTGGSKRPARGREGDPVARGNRLYR
jgi:hypothetical protein